MFSTIVLLYILAFCRVTVGLVFIISAIGKAREFSSFSKTIEDFDILPNALSNITALLFLCGEFAVIVLIISGGPLLIPAFSLAIFLLLLFCVALTSVIVRRIRTSCNCFGTNTKYISSLDIGRNVGFIVCAFCGIGILIWTREGQAKLNLVEWGLVGLGALVFVVIWIQLGEVIQLFHQV